MNADDLRSRLINLDEEINLRFEHRKFDCVIVGGGALLMMDFISRSTLDIDVLTASEELLKHFSKYDMNTKVAGLMYRFPYNYEDRLEKVDLQTEAITFYTLSLEDLVISKLYAGRSQDREDIRSKEIITNLDWDKLDELVVESEMSTLNDREYSELLTAYEEYKELKE